MKQRLSICIAFMVLFVVTSYAQGIKIVEMKESVSGSDAFHAPIDRNGHPCGLVKIQSMYSDLCFAGEVEGNFAFDNNEYKVFMAKGCKQLIIKRPQLIPIVVNFPDYGIEEIVSKATYNIILKEVKLNPVKNLLVIDVKPRNAKVYIDDLLIDNENGDGGYRLLLPKGEHLYKIECNGYRSYGSVIKIGKETQTVRAELESLMADVEIVSQTSGAHIFVDGVEVGVGSWKGKLPAGTYKIETKLDGFLSASQSISLDEKDNKAISIPSLKRAKGNISVLTNVKEAIVLLDGKQVSNLDDIKDVQTGEHVLMITAPFGYKSVEKRITVSVGSNSSVQVDLEPLNELYSKAFEGDINAQAQLCHQRMGTSKFTDKDSIERNYWFDTLYKKLEKIDRQSFDLVCPCASDGAGCDMNQAGIYSHFRNDISKAIRILLIWNKYHPDYDSVILELTGKYHNKKLYTDVIRWGTTGLDKCDFEGYMGCFLEYIADACISIGDVNRAIDIFKKHVYQEYGWEHGYLAVADIYKEKGDCKNAVVYYKKFLQEHTSDSYEISETKRKIRDCGY